MRSTYALQLGEQAEITPASGETAMRGEVVYCQRLDDGRFFVGIKIRESRIPRQLNVSAFNRVWIKVGFGVQAWHMHSSKSFLGPSSERLFH